MSPAREAFDHPIFGTRYRIWTKPLTEFRETIQKWLFAGISGAWSWGTSRAGKTEGIGMLTGHLLTRTGEAIKVLTANAKSVSRSTESKFWESFLLAFRLPYPERGNAMNKYGRVLSYIVEAAAENRERRVVLAINEAHKLNDDLYERLLDLANDLTDTYHIALFVLLSGPPVFKAKVSRYKSEPGYQHFNGRFFVRGARFYGLRSRSDVADALSQYDTTLIYPEGSHVSYTQHFLKQYDKGFRLASLSDLIWARFAFWRKQNQVEDWPMQHFTTMVNNLLVDFLPEEELSGIDETLIDEAIRSSALGPDVDCE